MGDRTYMQAYVYACPEDQRDAALAALAEYFSEAREADDSSDLLTTAYGEHDTSVGSSTELADALTKSAPGASFYLWEDPQYEWLGSVWAYTPGLGTFSAECDANGMPVFTYAEVMKAMTDESGQLHADAGIPAVLAEAMGRPWITDWQGSES